MRGPQDNPRNKEKPRGAWGPAVVLLARRQSADDRYQRIDLRAGVVERK